MAECGGVDITNGVLTQYPGKKSRHHITLEAFYKDKLIT